MRLGVTTCFGLALLPGLKPSKAWPKSRRIIPKVVLLMVVLVILDVLIGLTLCRNDRFFGRPLPPYDLTFTEGQVESLNRLGTERNTGARQFDSELGWCVRPNGTSEDGLERINSSGIRAGREYALQKPPGKTRIVTFGDSFTFCGEVANEDSWPQLLERAGKDLEVLNFGVSGYGNDQAYLRYLREGRQFESDIVLIGHFVENISRNVNVYRPAMWHGTNGVAVKPRFKLDEHGALVHVPCPAKSERELKHLIVSGRLLDTLRENDYWVYKSPLAYEDSLLFYSSIGRIAYAAYEQWSPHHWYYEDVTCESFQVTSRILQDFYQRALQDGADRAMVLVFPAKPYVHDHEDGKLPFWDTMTKHLQNAGIDVLDLTPFLAEAARREGIEPLFAEGGHYSPKGNAVVAEAIRKSLFPK